MVGYFLLREACAGPDFQRDDCLPERELDATGGEAFVGGSGGTGGAGGKLSFWHTRILVCSAVFRNCGAVDVGFCCPTENPRLCRGGCQSVTFTGGCSSPLKRAPLR